MAKITTAQLSLLFSSKKPTREEIDITPKMAEEWLARNKANRKIWMARVESYAAAMSGKRWRVTHQGIAFDRQGNLIDGQHRLTAIIKAGVTVRMLVTFGADFDDMMVCDQNGTRKPKDTLTIYNGRKNAGLRAAVIRILLAVEAERADYLPDAIQYLSEDNRHNAAFEWCLNTAHSRRDVMFAPYIAALIYAYERCPAETDVFLRLVVNPVGLTAGSAVIATQSMLINRVKADHRIVKGTDERRAAFRKMLRAIAAHATGETLKKLQDGEEGLKYFAKFPASV